MSFTEIVTSVSTLSNDERRRLLELLLDLDPLSPAEEAALNDRASRAALEPSRPLEDIAAELGL
jgi:predicted transcriptional regulator